MIYSTYYVGSIIYDPYDQLEEIIKIIRQYNRKLYRDICGVLRIAITGSVTSPPLFEVMEILGKDECIKRMLYAKNFL